jgi:transposase
MGILRGRPSDALDARIDHAIGSNIIPIMRFARTLHRDIDAIRNTIEPPRSNGQAEGQVNRLKTLTRPMYGRAPPVSGHLSAALFFLCFSGWRIGR